MADKSRSSQTGVDTDRANTALPLLPANLDTPRPADPGSDLTEGYVVNAAESQAIQREWEAADSKWPESEEKPDTKKTSVKKPEAKQGEKKPRKNKSFRVEGSAPYEAMRRAAFKLVYPLAIQQFFGRSGNPRIWPERDAFGNSMNGRIHVEADPKEIVSTIDDHTRLVSVKGLVVGVIYNSKTGSTALFWRASDSPGTPGRIWGHATRKTLNILLSCGIKVNPTEPMPAFQASDPED